MTSHLSTIICVIFGVVSLYYFNKYLDKQREFDKLHEKFSGIHLENQKMKSRIKDLQSYKDDVSKTFKILDNELLMINEHLKNQEQNHSIQASIETSHNIPNTFTSRIPLTRVTSFTNLNPGNNVSLLTPELLTSLFNMNSEDMYNRQHNIPNTPHNTPPNTPHNTPSNIQQQNVEKNIDENIKDNNMSISKSVEQNVEKNIDENILQSNFDEKSVYDNNRYNMISNYSEESGDGLEFNVKSSDIRDNKILYDISSQTINENSYDKYLLNN
jgi:hypothetical protein